MSDNGLYPKYEVRELDGTLLTDVFVLRPERDPVALEALIRYAELTGNVYLHDDLWKWIEQIRLGDDV